MPTATTSAAQPVATATPAVARAAAPDTTEASGDDGPPLLEQVPAWQVTDGILLATVLATIVLYLTVRFRGRASS
jgi:hypothetical protein